MHPLPIDPVLDPLGASLRAAGRLVLVAPPGAGKTTRVGPALTGSVSPGRVVILEPRRVAARLAAERVCEERGGVLGEEIGYRVRFERRASRRTRVLFCTYGVLLRDLLADPELPGIGVVVFDEFHERPLEGDLALSLLREVQETIRPDLKIVVMSATLDVGRVAGFLGGCPVLESAGREHPVRIEHLPVQDQMPLGDRVAAGVAHLARDRLEGAILAFVPGAAEIRRALEALTPIARRHRYALLPLHGSLPLQAQRDAIRGADRRIVVATNVAEASVTVEGVRAVVDTGRARMVRFDPRRGVDRMTTDRISRSSAVQRAGRAGRVAPGRCVRLYSAADLARRPEFAEPEVRRVDLCAALMQLYAWGDRDPLGRDWVASPPPEALDRARAFLRDLGAIEPDPSRAAPSRSAAGPRGSAGADSNRGGSGVSAGRITALGHRMLRFPVHPRHARVLEEAARLGVLAPAAEWVASREEGRTAAAPPVRDLRSTGLPGPVSERLPSPANAAGAAKEQISGAAADAARTPRMARLAAQLTRIGSGPSRGRTQAGGDRDAAPRRARSTGSGGARLPAGSGATAAAATGGRSASSGPAASERSSADARLRRSILAGHPDRVLLRRDPTAREGKMVGGAGVRLDRSISFPAGRLCVALDVIETHRRTGREVRARSAIPIEPVWLEALFPRLLERQFETRYVPELDRVVSRQVRTFAGLIIEERDTGRLDPEAAAMALARAAGPRLRELIAEDREMQRLLARIRFLARRRAEIVAEAAEKIAGAPPDADPASGRSGRRPGDPIPETPPRRSAAPQELDPQVPGSRRAYRNDPGPDERAPRRSAVGDAARGSSAEGASGAEDLENALLREALAALAPGRRSLRALHSVPWSPTVAGLLPRKLRAALDRYAPDRLELPSRRRARLDYEAEDGPVLAARLQEFFSLRRTPSVDGGRVPVKLHLLAPNHRPMQITTDLESFWANVYPKLRIELRRRYPKHSWPEDPHAAAPESRPPPRPRGRRG